MNQAIYEQLELGSWKSLFLFACLASKPSSASSLGSKHKARFNYK